MVERRATPRISNAEITAGVFLTFSIALFIGMLFVLGKFGHSLRGRQSITVAFAQVSALPVGAPVYYNGMDIGHVGALNIVRVDQALLSRIPHVIRRDVPNLPLTNDEREKLNATSDDDLDAVSRSLILNRTMVLLDLDLLSEHDTQRFRVDDEYRIDSFPMGDSAVDIRTGVGNPIPPAYKNVFIGIGGNMYTDLGSSLAQVKDILGSMAEMVGGDDNKRSIQAQLLNFDGFTANLEGMTSGMLDRLPKTWDATNERIDSTKGAIDEIQGKIKEIGPKIDEALTRAQKSIADARDGAIQSLKDADNGIQAYRKDAASATHDLAQTTAAYRDKIPEQIHEARDWSDRFGPTVEKIDNFCSRADDQLDKGIDSLRATLRGYTASATTIQQTLFNLKTWPWLLSHPPTEEQGGMTYFDNTFQRELVRQAYRELRGELYATRATLSANNPADQSRLSQIDQILKESDVEFPALPVEGPADAPPSSGRRK